MKKLALFASLLTACGDNADRPDPMDPTPDAPVEEQPPPLGITFFDDFHLAIDVSPDGKLAVFEELTQKAALVHFYDTITGETREAIDVGDPSRNIATGVANTGALSALHGEPVQAGLWTEATDWMDLGSPHAAGCGADEISGAFDISGDGSVVVGLAWNGCTPDAFRWSGGTFTSLEVLGTGFEGGRPTNRATVVSDDGRIAAGFAQNGPIDRSPAVWRADGTGLMLDPANQETPGEVLSISADGVVVAGILGQDAFFWTVGTGIVRLPRLDIALPSDPMFPNAMTADGERIFGGLGDAFFGIPVAFTWTEAEGTRPLADVIVAAGITLPEGMILNSVLGASADGTVLVGTAMDADFAPKTFVVRLRY
jgi:probable HAF family extracellular repeat protein